MFKFSVKSVPAHNRQIACYVTPSSSIAFQRSIFGLVRVYNKLPAEIVAAPSASILQRRLQVLLNQLIDDGIVVWHCSSTLLTNNEYLVATHNRRASRFVHLLLPVAVGK